MGPTNHGPLLAGTIMALAFVVGPIGRILLITDIL